MSNSTRLGRRGKATDPLPAGVADIAEQRQRTVANFPPSEAADLSDYLKRWRAGAPRRRAEEERAKNPPPGVLYARLRDKMPDDAVPDEGPRPEVDQGAYATSDPTAVVWTEQSLLGALMLGGDHFAAVDKVVHEQDFSRTEHQLVFSSMTKLNEGEQPIDATTVAQQLEDEQHLHKVGGVGYLADLVANTPGVMNVQVYAGKIRQAGNARRLSHEALEVSKAAHMSPEVRQAALADWNGSWRKRRTTAYSRAPLRLTICLSLRRSIGFAII